ncbi:4Fe-4S binding protein, partial [bacterium]|nr:4Fe-4S binding protein [bacterium]
MTPIAKLSSSTDKEPLITTIKERCRVCYTCVRECPAKAIRIFEGQAEVIPDRCIGCGNCVHVCSQRAKHVLLCIDKVNNLLKSDEKVSACVAPSFPAEFSDINYQEFVGMIRALGFDYVHEVAFGADIVAQKYHELINANKHQQYISANCPAIIEYICRYHPNLVNSLAPIVSPMLGTARAIRKLLGDDLRIVFIGPCLAKKKERDPAKPFYEIDAVITFIELRQMFAEQGISSKNIIASDFDEPHGHMGSLFPISRGMLKAACVSDDAIQGKVVAADGKRDFIEAIKEYETGDLNVGLLEILCCNGCIMGPGIKNDRPLFRRRSHVINYVKSHKAERNLKKWEAYVEEFTELDLSRGYLANNQCFPEPPEKKVNFILNKMGKFSINDELNCGACGYDSCHEHAVAIHKGLAESEMCLPYSIDQLKKTLQELS